MTNVKFPDISCYEDIETVNMYHERLEAGYKKDDIMRPFARKAVITPARRCSGVPKKMQDLQQAGRGSG